MAEISGGCRARCFLCGAPWGDSVVAPDAARLVEGALDREVRMHQRGCTRAGCSGLLKYDKLGVIVVHSRLVLLEDTVRYWMELMFSSGGTTFHQLATALSAGLVRNGRAPVHRRDVACAVYSLLRCLPLAESPCCTLCGPFPEQLCVDGTDASNHVRMDRLDDCPLPDPRDPSLWGLDAEDYLFLQGLHRAQGTNLKRWLAGQEVTSAGLIAGIPVPSLRKFVRENPICPAWLRPLCKVLYSTAPMLPLLAADPAGCIALLRSLADGGTAAHLDVYTHAPALLSWWLGDAEGGAKPIPPLLRDALREMADHAERTLRKPVMSKDHAVGTRPTTFDEDLRHGEVFLPHLRRRWVSPPRYANSHEQPTCAKGLGTTASFPLVLVIFSCPHNVVYGASYHNGAESVARICETVIQRFNPPPRVIVYDFACMAHRWMLRRWPFRAVHTRLVIDRFHEPNHTCAGYGAGVHKHIINTSGAEQLNARLESIVPQLRFMRSSTMMLTVAGFLFHNNHRVMRNLRAASSATAGHAGGGVVTLSTSGSAAGAGSVLAEGGASSAASGAAGGGSDGSDAPPVVGLAELLGDIDC